MIRSRFCPEQESMYIVKPRSLPQPSALPSFTELLTSIPLPKDFKSILHSSETKPIVEEVKVPRNTYEAPSAALIPKESTMESPNHYIHRQNYCTLPPSPYEGAPTPVPQAQQPAPSLASNYPVYQVYGHPTSPIYPAVQQRPQYGDFQAPLPSGKRRHMCKVCQRSFTTSGHLARHNRIHTGERNHTCPWPSCDARFARHDNCMQHYRIHTNNKGKRVAGDYKDVRSKSVH